MSLHGEKDIVTDHTQLLTQLDERSKSNVKRLNKNDDRIDELSKFFGVLQAMESDIKHISEKIDRVGIDKNIQLQQLDIHRKQLELEEKRVELENKRNKDLLQTLAEIGKKTFKEKLEDAAMPVMIVLIIYIIVEAAKGGFLL